MTAEAFFTTIATITATVIGFALAIFTVYFRINRERQLDQTEAAIDSVEDFATKYQSTVKRTKSLLAHESGPDLGYDQKKFWAVNDPDELKKKLQDDDGLNYVEATYLYTLLDGIMNLCETIGKKDTSAGEIPDARLFKKQASLIKALHTHSNFNEYSWKRLNRELTGLEIIHSPDSPSYDDDLLPEGQSKYYPDSLYYWAAEQDDEFFRGFEQFNINGLGMPSIHLFARSMESDWNSIMRELRGSLVNYGPERDLLKFVHKPASGAILIFGLIVPLLALVDTGSLAQILSFPSAVADGTVFSDVLIEVVQIVTVPILLVSSSIQVSRIYREIINIGPS